MNQMTELGTGSGPSKVESWKMFDKISGRYDALNRILSMGIDVGWRKLLAAHLPDRGDLAVLDLATGTGDQIISMVTENAGIRKAIGLDMAEKMIEIGRRKLAERGLSMIAELQVGDAMKIPFEAGTFDALSMSFGIRNVPDVNQTLSEMHRVLKPGGRALILEFSIPSRAAIRSGYLLYLRHVLPHLGTLLSGDGVAYRYLNQTIETFPYGDEFCGLMKQAGFARVEHKPLTLGIATLYIADKA